MMKKLKIARICLAAAALILASHAAFAWNDNGVIPGTEVHFSDLVVTKRGVSVTFTNKSINPVRISSVVTFYDAQGNKVGSSIFAIREIESGAYVKIGENYLDGTYKKTKEAPRMVWDAMTYELVFN